MEKKSRTGDSVFLKLPRMFLIMKTVFISLVCTLNVQANVFSQHTKFDIAMKNVTVSEVLCYLEEISKYRFVYDSDAIDRMQRVDVEMKGTNSVGKYIREKWFFICHRGWGGDHPRGWKETDNGWNTPAIPENYRSGKGSWRPSFTWSDRGFKRYLCRSSDGCGRPL